MNKDYKNQQQNSHCHCNQGVRCDVKNCVYHDGEQECVAGKITVGPTFAISPTDTVCSTFKSK